MAQSPAPGAHVARGATSDARSRRLHLSKDSCVHEVDRSVSRGVAPSSSPALVRRLEITGVAHDSRKVKPGDLFVALPGTKADGAQLRRGRHAEGRGRRRGREAGRRPMCPVFKVSNARKALALIAAQLLQEAGRAS